MKKERAPDDKRPIVVGCFISGARASYLAELPEGWGFAWSDTKPTPAEVRAVVGNNPYVFVAWSQGCGWARGLVSAGLDPIACLLLDGTSVSPWPPNANADAAFLGPWRAYASRARLGDRILFVTGTEQTYVEGIVPTEANNFANPYGSTLRSVTCIWRQQPLLPLQPVKALLAPTPHDEPLVAGLLHVEVHDTAGNIDGAGHKAELHDHGPRLFRELVAKVQAYEAIPFGADPTPVIAPAEPAPPPTDRSGGAVLPPSPARPALRLGSPHRGDVVTAQRLLNVTADGVFGPKTKAAVVAFQQAHPPLDVDGVVGPATWAALGAGGRADDKPTDPAPAPNTSEIPNGSLGAAALALAREKLGFRETGVNVVPFAPRTVRNGKWIDVQGVPFMTSSGPQPGSWCARFVSEVVHRATHGFDWARPLADLEKWVLDWAPGDPAPIGYRAAVAEVCDDARATGRLHVTRAGLATGAQAAGDGGYEPRAGDLCIFARAGGNPLLGGPGHVAFVEAEFAGGDTLRAVGGNQGNAVSIEARRRSEVLAWIALS